MPSNISAQCNLPADSATAYALLTNQSAIAESYAGRKGVEVSVTKNDSGHVVWVRRPITAGPLKTALSLKQSWRSLDSANSYTADINYRLLATPIQVLGKMQLLPTHEGSVLTADLTAKVAIPLVGSAISTRIAKIISGKLVADLEYQRATLAAQN